MPVSGLVVTLSADAALAAGAVSMLRCLPGVELGERRDARLPVVTEAASSAAAHDLHDAIRALPGVIHVDVTFVAYEDDGGATSPQAPTGALQPCDSKREAVRVAEVLP